ncbi:MAG: hypothetical protein AAF371_02380 [Pseudomonadota bacterium]
MARFRDAFFDWAGTMVDLLALLGRPEAEGWARRLALQPHASHLDRGARH